MHAFTGSPTSATRTVAATLLETGTVGGWEGRGACIQAGFAGERGASLFIADVSTVDASAHPPAPSTGMHAGAPRVAEEYAFEFSQICVPKHPQVPAHFGCCADDCTFDCSRHNSFDECAYTLIPSLMCQWTGSECISQPSQYTVVSKDEEGVEKFKSVMQKHASSLANHPRTACSHWHQNHTGGGESILRPDQ